METYTASELRKMDQDDPMNWAVVAELDRRFNERTVLPIPQKLITVKWGTESFARFSQTMPSCERLPNLRVHTCESVGDDWDGSCAQSAD